MCRISVVLAILLLFSGCIRYTRVDSDRCLCSMLPVLRDCTFSCLSFVLFSCLWRRLIFALHPALSLCCFRFVGWAPTRGEGVLGSGINYLILVYVNIYDVCSWLHCHCLFASALSLVIIHSNCLIITNYYLLIDCITSCLLLLLSLVHDKRVAPGHSSLGTNIGA